MSYTDVKTWRIEELIDALSKNPQKKEKIIIPQYQRNLVWNNKQKKLLIDSIKNGMPIGSILLYHEMAEDGYNIYHLVDGLQRSTSIKSYNETPTLFFSKDNISEKLLSILSEYLEVEKEIIEKLFIEWIQTLKGFNESDGYSSSSLAYFLDDKTGEKLEKKQIQELSNILPDFLEQLSSESNINDKLIPVIIYHGKKSDLPTIFERINSKGTQLNKYQIYAATWSTYDSINIGNIEIIKKIQQKYESLLEEGLEIENYDPSNFNTAKFNYFEYFFGLGKLLSDKYPVLFGKSNRKDQTESIGFNIGSICLKNDLKKMGELPERLLNINMDKYEKCILDAVKISYDYLKPFISFKANKNGTTFKTCHTEMQIVSIIGKVFHTKYNNSFEVKKYSIDKLKVLKRTIPYHYLYDIFRNYWSGTGDTKAFDLITSQRYESEIKKSQWNNILDEWFESEINKKEQSRVTVKPQAILFLRYIYTHLFSAHEELSTTIYEVEHLCPIAKLKKVAKLDIIEGLPISCISNLCIIEQDLNKIKGSKTIYEYYDDLKSKNELTDLQISEEISKLEERTFTDRKNLEFMINFDQNNIDDYNKFLKNRFEILKDKFFNLNKIN